MSDDVFLGITIGVFVAFLMVLSSPRPQAQREWDLQTKVEALTKQRDDLAHSYLVALRRAAVCVKEPVDRREVK